jgi:pimeloyl-ACP methyl ester carboxylesterase
MTELSTGEMPGAPKETLLTLTGAEHTPVPAIFTEPPDSTKRAVILCHGFLSDKQSRTNRRLTELLIPEGLATFRFDWYGMGDLRKEFPHLTIHQCLDQLTAIVTYLLDRGYSSLGIVGSSFGGFMTILTAARIPNLRAVGLKCPVVDFAESLRLEFGEAGMTTWQQTNHIPHILEGQGLIPLHYAFFQECLTYDGYDWASRMRVPTRVVHGGKDTIIPSHQIIRLMENLPGPKDLRLLPEADHQFGRPEDFRVMTVLLAQWMIEQVTDSKR